MCHTNMSNAWVCVAYGIFVHNCLVVSSNEMDLSYCYIVIVHRTYISNVIVIVNSDIQKLSFSMIILIHRASEAYFIQISNYAPGKQRWTTYINVNQNQMPNFERVANRLSFNYWPIQTKTKFPITDLLYR